MDLITDAYNIQMTQVSGEPRWARTDRYDVEAKAASEGALAWDRARPMLQSMLTQRFKLDVRHHAREVAAYDLVLTNRGPKFRKNIDPDAKSRRVTKADLAGTQARETKATMARLTTQLP